MTMKSVRLLAAACAVLLSLSPALAQETLSPPHIRVSGEATLSVPPDMARMRAGVTATGKTANDAAKASGQAMAQVLAAIKDAGIGEKDVQTSRYSIQPVYGDNQARQKITGFIASNSVTITVRKLEDIGGLMDKLVTAGANTVGGIEFVVTNASKLMDSVRADALKDAKRKAQIYADTAGMKLGGVLSLSESVNTPMPMMAMRAAAPSQDTPVAIGESTLHVSVNAVFELAKP
jgi:hypothetical protein